MIFLLWGGIVTKVPNSHWVLVPPCLDRCYVDKCSAQSVLLPRTVFTTWNPAHWLMCFMCALLLFKNSLGQCNVYLFAYLYSYLFAHF